MIRENKFDFRLLQCFTNDEKLGLAGFIGSTTIDQAGGRGGGTMAAFIGAEYKTIWATPASVHGLRVTGVHPAAVLDHCVMIFRLSVLKELPTQEDTHTPGHFYDRVLSCEVLNRGYHVVVIGIFCDHGSGGTGLCKVPGEHLGVKNRDEMYRKWLAAHNLPADTDNPDLEIYKEGERRFLSKWRDELRFVPVHVNSDYSIHQSTR